MKHYKLLTFGGILLTAFSFGNLFLSDSSEDIGYKKNSEKNITETTLLPIADWVDSGIFYDNKEQFRNTYVYNLWCIGNDVFISIGTNSTSRTPVDNMVNLPSYNCQQVKTFIKFNGSFSKKLNRDHN